MFKGSAVRMTAAVAACVMTVGGGLSLTSVAASAATTAKAQTVKYSCKVPVIGNQSVTAKVTLSAPAKATTGKTANLSIQVQPSGLPAVSVTNLTVKSTLTLSGAQKGSVTLSEFLSKANSGNLKLKLSGHLKLAKAGPVRLTAGPSVTFSLTSSLIGKATLTCRATSKLPVLGTISVSKPRHGRLTN